MSKNQLHDFASTKGLKEHSPVHFLKREGISLEGSEASRLAGKGKHFEEPDYVSGEKSSRWIRAPRNDKFYKDHGKGSRFEEMEDYDEDRVQKGKVFKNGPRISGVSTDLENKLRED